MLLKPGISNIALAKKIGLHRNTIPKLLSEIKEENDKSLQFKRKELTSATAEHAITSLKRLEKAAYFADKKYDAKETVMVAKAQWSIIKDLYRIELEFYGLHNPQPYVQVNIQNNK